MTAPLSLILVAVVLFGVPVLWYWFFYGGFENGTSLRGVRLWEWLFIALSIWILTQFF